MKKESEERRTEKDCATALDRRAKNCKEHHIFNPQYSLREEYLDSLRCRCSCAPSPGPYCH